VNPEAGVVIFLSGPATSFGRGSFSARLFSRLAPGHFFQVERGYRGRACWPFFRSAPGKLWANPCSLGISFALSKIPLLFAEPFRSRHRLAVV